MESPSRLHDQPNTATRNSASPEFEFWMVRNPSYPQPHLLSAEELFHDGVLLPLNILYQPERKPSEEEEKEEDNEPGPNILTQKSTESLTGSKRWKDMIFRKHDKTKEEKEKKKDKRIQTGATSSSGTELNINIWPFSRSRSACNSVTRPRLFPGSNVTRKVSSAPCSRSNSGGELKSRKWPSSPSRLGVHLGRNSPVWQVRRGSGTGSKETAHADNVVMECGKVKTTKSIKTKVQGGVGDGNSRANKVLNLKVQSCIGCRHRLSCRSDENSAVGVGTVTGGGGAGGSAVGGGGNSGGNGSNLFSIRSLFTKNVS